MNSHASYQMLIDKLVKKFSTISNVEAIAVAGSYISDAKDMYSDIDLYVYTTSVIPLRTRASLVQKLKASRTDLNLQIWDLGDEWIDAKTGIEIDVIYWDTRWIEKQLERVLLKHQASAGYTTCFWYTIYNSQILYDRTKWLQSLQKKSKQKYPEKLRTAIISTNHGLLKRIIPSYSYQIEKAVARKDLVSINHRVAGLLASYFDILFALNRLLHPGEKRLLEFALTNCAHIPHCMSRDIVGVLHAAGSTDKQIIKKIDTLVNNLNQLLLNAGFDPNTSLPISN